MVRDDGVGQRRQREAHPTLRVAAACALGPFALNGPKLGPTTHGRLTRLWPFERAGPRTGKTAQEVTGKCPRPSRALRCHEPRAPARILGCQLGPGNHISLLMPRL